MSIRVLVAIAALFLVNTPATEAQRSAPMSVELSGGYAYQWGGSSDITGGQIEIPTSGSYGFTLDVPVRSGGKLELLWWRQDTSAEFNAVGVGPNVGLTDVAVEYWQMGGMTEVRRGNVSPFVVLTLGATRLIGKGNTTGNETRFSGTLGGGLKVSGQGRVGLRLEGRLLVTSSNTDSAFFCGLGGCAIGLVGDPIAQGVLSASLFLKLGGPR